MFERLTETAGLGSRLSRKAPVLDTRFMLSAGDEDYIVTIAQGAVISVEAGPFVMPSYSFRIVTSRDEWEKFLEEVPKPGSNDLLAMLRRKVLAFEGNLHPLMANLLYFKLILASLRPQGVTS